MNGVVLHGRREGLPKSANVAHHKEFVFDPRGRSGTQCSNPVDLRQVTILSRPEWERIQNHLNSKDNLKERANRKKEENLRIHEMSKDMVKDWPNTLLGGRQRKLEDRRVRLEEEEKERRGVDLEEAQYAAERRKEGIEKAKIKQYYQTDRVKGFHSALLLTEVMKEREAQVELKQLMKSVKSDKGGDFQEMWQREYEESLKKDHELAEEHIRNRMGCVEYVKHQIEQNKEKKAKQMRAAGAEGEELRRLAIAHQLETKRLEQITQEEQNILMRQKLQQISDVHKMKEIDKLKQEEDDEECRIFAAAKKKMMILRAEKERQLHLEKQTNLERIKDKLSKELALKNDTEEERLQNAVHEAEEKFQAEEEDKATKAKRMMEEIEHHRDLQNKKIEKERKEKRMQDLEMLRVCKEADEQFRLNEAEKARKKLEDEKRMTQYLEKQRDGRLAIGKLAREKNMRFAKENQEILQLEEAEFQDYASRVIEHSKKGGRNTYALERAAKEGIGGGLGKIFPGRGGIRPSYLDANGVQLPNFQNNTTSEIKDLVGEDGKSDERLGFVW